MNEIIESLKVTEEKFAETLCEVIRSGASISDVMCYLDERYKSLTLLVSEQARKQQYFDSLDVNELTEIVKPLIKYLNDKHNPHAIAIVTTTGVEVLGGIMSNPNINDFIKD